MTFNIETLFSVLISIGGGLIGGFISWRIHTDSKKMWRNEIFVKTMQEKLVNFNYSLYETIKNDYDSSTLCSLLNNEFDFNSIKFTTFFKNKFKIAKELEEQFIFLQPYLKKCLKIKENELLKLSMYLNITSLIYGYFVSIQEVLSLPVGPDLDDYFNMGYNKEANDLEIDNMLPSTQKELQEKFKFHLNVANIVLSKDNKNALKTLESEDSFYRVYLVQIRENLFKFNKLISNYMWKEL